MEAINLCNNGVCIKVKLELFLKQLSGKKFHNFQHLRERVAANDFDEDNTKHRRHYEDMRVKLPNF